VARVFVATARVVYAVGVRVLPKNHPSRIYLDGRQKDGWRRIDAAIRLRDYMTIVTAFLTL
jgi:hypothetical protein